MTDFIGGVVAADAACAEAEAAGYSFAYFTRADAEGFRDLYYVKWNSPAPAGPGVR